MKSKNHKNAGQVLLIVVLLATVLVTIGLSVSHISTEETRIAKLEEESKKAFAAAEAGIEAAINLNPGETFSNFSTLGLDADITGLASVAEPQSATFTTPVLAKDEQYTFYLSNYDSTTKQITGSASTDNLKISHIQPTSATYCTDNNAVNAFAVEITFLNKENNRVVGRKLIDECDIIDNHTTLGAVDEVDFNQRIDLSATPAHIIILRILAPDNDFGGAQLGVVNDEAPQNNWPAQGKTITSRASIGASGVSKTIELFQSYPQIPSDFFVTSF